MDDRAEAIDILTRMSTNHFYGHREQEAFKLGAKALSAERLGRWVVLGDQIENQTFDECKCSECGCVEYFNKGWKHFDYCPNCGARMEATE